MQDQRVEAAINGSSAAKVSSEEKMGEVKAQVASVKEMFSFANSNRVRWQMAAAFTCAVFAGSTLPAMCFFLADAFKSLAADTNGRDFMETVRRLSLSFVVLGVIILISSTGQNFWMERAASEMALNFKTSWFKALLRQDMAYYDIRDVSGEATIVSTNGSKYKKGVGRKLAESVQCSVMFFGAMAYSFFASWQVSLAVLGVAPFLYLSIILLVRMNNSQTARANATYAKAGAIVNTSLGSLRTILALNAVEVMIDKFKAATAEALEGAVSQVGLLGFANGTQWGSFMLSYVVVTLLGSWLLYDNVKESGCDPSGTVEDNQSCKPAGLDVFGALLGVGFAASVLPQVGVAIESFSGARVACYHAIEVINRKVDESDHNADQANGTMQHYKRGSAGLPPYKIDSASVQGKKPNHINGDIEFRNVHFSYPTRSEVEVFKGFSLTIPAGKTVALVGESGSGKSTSVQLLERFYDPTSGSISIDGVDIRDLNVKWLRQHIGLVSQEPKLFGTSIRENIAAGAEDVTDQDIVEAAKRANADTFIRSFPDGYNTHVGDVGGKLSGGQKQRIAISRVLVKKPKILILDEATSALDSESEAIVQSALDQLVQQKTMTILVIAHRLSTIKNADIIAVVSNGQVVETGTHDELLLKKGHYYKLVQAQSGPPTNNENQNEEFDQEDEHVGSADAALNEVVPTPLVDDSSAMIQFRDVSFSYPSRPNISVLRGFNLSVRRGETVALVGPSGCGKSTVIQLLECFYRPSSGQILFNGHSLTEINVRWLRDQLGLVSQEPLLFDMTIEENIRMGLPSASSEQIIAAAKLANAHKFISTFPDGYNTRVGQGSTLVSGGQKQRIAIARALLKNPPVLLLDEATSALDSESEKIVQETLDSLLSDESRTCIVIAHRLSTIRNADRIAVVDKGKVIEVGTHDQLMSNPKSRYRRLQQMQSLDKNVSAELQSGHDDDHQKTNEHTFESKNIEQEVEEDIGKDEEKELPNKARFFASGDFAYIAVGVIGACLAGLVFPSWGFAFAYMVQLLYVRVELCPSLTRYGSCDEYWTSVANKMQEQSFFITYAFLGIIVASLVGYTLLFWGFGTAVERMNKRLRDAAFASLLRQEIAWLDLRSAWSLSASLAEDTALLRAFAGEPVRTFVLALASVLVGVLVAFVFMWPFALVALGILPFMAFGAEMEMRDMLGEDEGDDEQVEKDSPGQIVIETLSDIRTVASLSLEERRAMEYKQALEGENARPLIGELYKGAAAGLGQFVQLWGMGLMYWWGGWLLRHYPNLFSFKDYLISLFAFFLSLYGLAMAFQGTAERGKAKLAAHRIFGIIERRSLIDPLSDEGKKDV